MGWVELVEAERIRASLDFLSSPSLLTRYRYVGRYLSMYIHTYKVQWKRERPLLLTATHSGLSVLFCLLVRCRIG